MNKATIKSLRQGPLQKRIIAWFKFYVWKHLQINILKGTVLQLIFFLKSGHYGAVDLWNNSHILKYILKN